MTAAADIPSPDQIRQAADAVLAQPQFRPTVSETVLQAAWHKVLAWIDALGHWSASHPTGALLLMAALAVLLVAIVAHLVWTAYRALAGGGDASGRRSAAAPWEVLEGAAANWPEAVSRARQALGRGDLRRALWLGHRVLLGLLDQAGAIQFAGHKTNAAYLAECDPNSPQRDTLVALTDVYDRVVYGHAPAPSARVGELLERVAANVEGG